MMILMLILLLSILLILSRLRQVRCLQRPSLGILTRLKMRGEGRLAELLRRIWLSKLSKLTSISLILWYECMLHRLMCCMSGRSSKWDGTSGCELRQHIPPVTRRRRRRLDYDLWLWLDCRLHGARHQWRIHGRRFSLSRCCNSRMRVRL